MRINIKGIINKVRVAIDENVRLSDTDDFYNGLDREIRQALVAAIHKLAMILPADMLEGKTLPAETIEAAQQKNSDGSGYIILPPDYLRLIELKLRTWGRSVYATIDPLSDEAKKQSCRWTRGTAQKPVAIEVQTGPGRVLHYWSADFGTDYQGKRQPYYDHRVETLLYVASPLELEDSTSENGTEVEIPIREAGEHALIYYAAYLVLLGKGETALAEAMKAEANINVETNNNNI